MAEIELKDGLPAWPPDDEEFLQERMQSIPPGTITDIVRALGFKDRHSSTAPTTEYHRIRDALASLLKRGVVEKTGKLWRLKPKKNGKARMSA